MDNRTDTPEGNRTPAALELSWKPERADLVEALRAANRSRGVPWKLCLFAAVSCAVMAWAGRRAGEGAAPGLVLFVVLLLVVLLSRTVMVPVLVNSAWRKNAALRAPVWAGVDSATGITIRTAAVSTYPWSSVRTYQETDNVFVVHLAGFACTVIVLVKRGLPAAHEVETLRRLLTAGTAGSAAGTAGSAGVNLRPAAPR